ncbi:lipocalin family protein [Paludibacterium yongneupense]|uniref:lipocalin family protein n=1 Tax=Paludibacterium yongneupense TaxID=400061 RepID=UPI00042075A5|nr:lipocalin family protein [Paludibacterium yongneupense]
MSGVWLAGLGAALALNVALAGDAGAGRAPYGTWYEWAHYHAANSLECAQATVLILWPSAAGIEVLRQCRDGEGAMRRSDEEATGSGGALSWKVYSIWPFYHRERVLLADPRNRYLVVGADGLDDVMVFFATPDPAADLVGDVVARLAALGVEVEALVHARRIDTAHAARDASDLH